MQLSSYIEVLRLAAVLNAPNPEPEQPRASRGELQQLVAHQLRAWEAPKLNRATLRTHCHALDSTAPHVFAFEIENGVVSYRKKPPELGREHPNAHVRRNAPLCAYRALLYRVFLQALVSRCGLRDMTVAIDTSDGEGIESDGPIFAFQTRSESSTILLPDVDFFHWFWYAKQRDDVPYAQKKIAACFVGSSTGARVTKERIEHLALPRFAAAEHFLDDPHVYFRIANAVQVDSPESKELLQRQRWFSDPMPWPEQLRYRFLISMDGNGAACSRLVMALRSHAVLLKYRSPSELYYFSALQSGREYIDIEGHEHVSEVVRAELASPGRFEPIAEAGRRFAARYLNQHSVTQYAALLLQEYALRFHT